MASLCACAPFLLRYSSVFERHTSFWNEAAQGCNIAPSVEKYFELRLLFAAAFY